MGPPREHGGMDVEAKLTLQGGGGGFNGAAA